MKPLKPVMAALLAATSATFGMPRFSYADDAPATAPADPSATPPADPAAASVPPSAPAATPVSPCSAADAQTNPVNTLACLISQNPSVRADIGTRLASFMQSKYMTPGLLGDAPVLQGVLAVAKAWPEKNKDNPGRVAILYFVIGPDGALPSWAQSNANLSKTLQPGMKWNARLAKALANRHWTDTKQIAESGAVDAAAAFLEDAADQAQKVLDDPRTKKDISVSIGANDTTTPLVPTTSAGGSANPLTPTGSGFNREDMYVKGAEVGNVYAPNDKGYRTLSMKVFSKKNDDGTIINTLAIVDITAGELPSVPQFIDISRPTDKPIDVVMRDGGRHYSVTVGPDGSVTLTRAGATGGGAIKTSRAQLTADRDDQIRSCGIVMIAGQPYYALGQGGVKGSLLFFSKAQMDADPNANAHPALMGDVAQVAIGDGSTQQVKGKPDLGTLADGSAWHLEFNMQTGLWNVVSGQGDDIKKPGGGGSTPPAKTPGGGATPPGSTPPATPQTADGGTTPPANLDDAVALAAQDKPNKDQVWALDPADGNAGALSGSIRIMSNTRADGMKHFLVLFDPSLGVANNQFEFMPMSQNILLTGIDVVSKYVVMEYSTNSQYYDLPNFVAFIKHATDPSQSPVSAGSYAASNGQMQNVTDVDIAADILINDMQVAPNDPMIQTIRDRVAKYTQSSGGYVLNGDTKALYFGSGTLGMTIWPNEVKAGDTGNNDGMTGLRGPGTAVNLAAGPAADFKDTMDIGGGVTATRLKPVQPHAALYTDNDTEPENVNGTNQPAKITYIMIDYLMDGQLSRTKPFAVFGGHDRFQLPVGYQMQGLETVEMDPKPTDSSAPPPKSAPQLAMLTHSSQSDGAIVAYRYVVPSSSGTKDPAGNCAGPVIWWGKVTQAMAQAACAGSGSL